MADRTVFVDGTTSGTPGTTGAHYASLSAAITGEAGAAPNLVSGAAILNIECSVFSGSAADTTAVDITGFTTDSTHYVNIYMASGSRHAGVWDATKYRLAVANPAVAVLRIRQEYTRVDGIQVQKTASNANDQMIVQIDGSATGSVILTNAIVRNTPSDSFRAPNIWVVNSNVTAYIINCICYGSPDVVSNYASAIMVEAGTAYVYSCTGIGGFVGFFLALGATATCKNCYFAENSSDGSAASITENGSFTQVTCAVSDGSTLVDAGLRNIAYNTTNFTNVTSGSENLHLPSGSALIDVGTNTSGESDPLNFTTDIDGATRSGTWDIGADERASSTPVTIAPGLGNDALTGRTVSMGFGIPMPNQAMGMTGKLFELIEIRNTGQILITPI